MNDQLVSNTQLSSNQTDTQQSPPVSVYLEKIGGSNNSTVFELYGYQQSPESLNLYPRKGFSLNKVLKTVNHTCSKGNSQLKIHRTECYHLANEAQILSQVNHPYIIKPQEFINNCKEYCGLMLPKADFDLFQMIQNSQGKPDVNLMKALFRQILSAVAYLHDEKKIAHNDIKLANLFIFKSKNAMVLADFGFSKVQSEESNDAEEQLERWRKRAFHTLSPEMIEKIQSNDAKTYVNEEANDMFALGVSLFEAIFHMSPFASEHASPQDALYGPFFQGTQQELMKFWSNKNISQRLLYYKNHTKTNLSQLLDLLSKMLTVAPEKRITASQALNHPWFQ